MAAPNAKGGSNFFLKTAIVVIIIFSLIMIVRLQIESNNLQDQRDALQTRIDELDESISELEYQLEMAFDDEQIIRIARRRLGLRLPNEIVFINDIRD
ncbi:MAG: septum formation initiator family protein [Oscillospiraceae bacterium]|nr:septum formation initiator family protein [Oscillospiraceae bacterium]